jgi:hypothetical protein
MREAMNKQPQVCKESQYSPKYGINIAFDQSKKKSDSTAQYGLSIALSEES